MSSKILPLIFVIFTSLFGIAPLPAQSPATPIRPAISELREVKTVYVSVMDPTILSQAGVIREKLITFLVEGYIAVVESEDQADALLSGLWLTERESQTSCRLRGTVRLLNQNGLVLWAADISNDPYAPDAASSFAESAAKRLVEAMAAAAANNVNRNFVVPREQIETVKPPQRRTR